MKLYIVHVGFYDQAVAYGVYESHTNFFVVAENEREAKKKTLAKPIFQERNMHIDGIQEILVVDGYAVKLEKVEGTEEIVHNLGYSQSKALS